jgi:hypothetical protein
VKELSSPKGVQITTGIYKHMVKQGIGPLRKLITPQDTETAKIPEK